MLTIDQAINKIDGIVTCDSDQRAAIIKVLYNLLDVIDDTDRDRLTGPMVGEQTMLKVAGKSFRCDCGCNVFTKIHDTKFRCNSCTEDFVSSES